jgi:putative transposase
MERANRTLRESLDELEMSNRSEAEAALKAIIANYKSVRLYSALGFKPPAIYYRVNPAELDANRALKLRQAPHRRREANLKLKEKTLGLSATESIA